MAINSKLNHDDFLTRLKLIIGNEKPFGWAKRIGIPTSSFSTMWNDGVVPKANTLLSITSETGVSIDWLLTGEGPMRRGEAGGTTGSEPEAVIKERPATAWDASQLPPEIDLTRGVTLLAKIYGSGNQILIRAIIANLLAFAEAIDNKQRALELEIDNRELRARVDTLEQRLAALEQRINQKKQAAA